MSRLRSTGRVEIDEIGTSPRSISCGLARRWLLLPMRSRRASRPTPRTPLRSLGTPLKPSAGVQPCATQPTGLHSSGVGPSPTYSPVQRSRPRGHTLIAHIRVGVACAGTLCRRQVPLPTRGQRRTGALGHAHRTQKSSPPVCGFATQNRITGAGVKSAIRSAVRGRRRTPWISAQ